ncbi:UDP-4-amino-4,6-dideoxy-N-acetyl-beta-L-altrosamine transaminase [Schleiferiaceae bacterium]|nr:UDP-4-amino-4,6-dideoxy-N-acetyl-beta-L-altrosamine transaminase [Schleiferiaceae bacterium]
MIPYGRQNITEEDIQAVVETLKSDYLTQGPKILEFERAFAEYIGSKYAVAVANGTAALHLNTLALGVKPGDKVITTPITFAASANCVRYCGGEVVFADIHPETSLLDIHAVSKLLEASPKGTYQGIIPVDFAGRAVDLEAFRALADEFGCWIIEDACHSPGGYFIDIKGNKQHCGNGNFADLAIFSFHPVKHIASGEGGMITTNNEELYQKLLMLRTHGIVKNNALYQNSIDFAIGTSLGFGEQNTDDSSPMTDYPLWYMEMQALSYNYRITDFQAALGLSQLKRADEGLQRRRKIASIYAEAFKNIPQITDRNVEAVNSTPLTAHRSHQNGHAYHLYVLEVENRLRLYNYLRENQIFAQIHYIPVHLMPYYRQFGWKEGDMPYAENYYKHCISLPMYPTLTEDQQQFVINTILKFYA